MPAALALEGTATSVQKQEEGAGQAVQSMLNQAVAETQTRLDTVANRLKAIINEYDRRERCHSKSGGAMFYNGENCNTPRRVRDWYMDRKCDRRAFPANSCEPGFVQRSTGEMIHGDLLKGEACSSYCSKKVGKVCVWRKAMEDYYNFCVRYSNEETSSAN